MNGSDSGAGSREGTCGWEQGGGVEDSMQQRGGASAAGSTAVQGQDFTEVRGRWSPITYRRSLTRVGPYPCRKIAIFVVLKI